MVVVADGAVLLADVAVLLATLGSKPSEAGGARVGGAWGSNPARVVSLCALKEGASLVVALGSIPVGVKSLFALGGFNASSSSRWGGSSVKCRSSEFITSAADSVTAEK